MNCSWVYLSGHMLCRKWYCWHRRCFSGLQIIHLTLTDDTRDLHLNDWRPFLVWPTSQRFKDALPYRKNTFDSLLIVLEQLCFLNFILYLCFFCVSLRKSVERNLWDQRQEIERYLPQMMSSFSDLRLHSEIFWRWKQFTEISLIFSAQIISHSC